MAKAVTSATLTWSGFYKAVYLHLVKYASSDTGIPFSHAIIYDLHNIWMSHYFGTLSSQDGNAKEDFD